MKESKREAQEQGVWDVIDRAYALVGEENYKEAFRIAEGLLNKVPKECVRERLALFAIFTHGPGAQFNEQVKQEAIAIASEVLRKPQKAQEILVAARLLSSLGVRTAPEHHKLVLDAAEWAAKSKNPHERLVAATVIACQSAEHDRVRQALPAILESGQPGPVHDACLAAGQLFNVDELYEEGVSFLDQGLEMMKSPKRVASLCDQKLVLLANITWQKRKVLDLYGGEADWDALRCEAEDTYERLCKTSRDAEQKARTRFNMAVLSWYTGDSRLARSYLAVALDQWELLIEQGKFSADDELFRQAVKWKEGMDEQSRRGEL